MKNCKLPLTNVRMGQPVSIYTLWDPRKDHDLLIRNPIIQIQKSEKHQNNSRENAWRITVLEFRIQNGTFNTARDFANVGASHVYDSIHDILTGGHVLLAIDLFFGTAVNSFKN